MPSDFKFGVLGDGSEEIAYAHPDVWSVGQTTGPSRLIVAPATQHVRLLRELSDVMAEPFEILYVLVVPRSEDEPGRYQSPFSCSRQDVSSFLHRFGDFLESDGRHHVWIKSIGEPDLLVYDRHNVIYGYGPLVKFKTVLTARGITEVAKVRIPSPHVHRYRQEYDAACRDLLDYWDWQHSPLLEADSE